MLEAKQIDKKDIQVYLDILMERALWLERIGQPMWNTANLNPVNFEKMYPDNMPYLVYENNTVIGGFVLVEQDRFLWTDEENQQTALYIHKLVVKPEYAGKGYAKKMINLVKEIAKKHKVEYLRLDCYEDRTYLVKLYEDCGFVKKHQVVMEDGVALRSYEIVL